MYIGWCNLESSQPGRGKRVVQRSGGVRINVCLCPSLEGEQDMGWGSLALLLVRGLAVYWDDALILFPSSLLGILLLLYELETGK